MRIENVFFLLIDFRLLGIVVHNDEQQRKLESDENSKE
jgi:hypothetical protein